MSRARQVEDASFVKIVETERGKKSERKSAESKDYDYTIWHTIWFFTDENISVYQRIEESIRKIKQL